MNFAVIGINSSQYAVRLLEHLLQEKLTPDYVLIEDADPNKIAASLVFIDTSRLPHPEDYDGYFEHVGNMAEVCRKYGVPFYFIESHNGESTIQVLRNQPIDILLITEGPIIRSNVLHLPKLGVLNMHPAPLPQYRGNWTTRISLYNDEPPTVSAHVVTPWIDEGPIVRTVRFSVHHGDTLEEIDRKAQRRAIQLAAETLKEIAISGLRVRHQPLWAGNTYKGYFKEGKLYPAMPEELQEELRMRLSRGEYGFYDG
jgi:folate-dependent phosphoribosylglycinamide formyltransferase PurN